MKRTILVLFLSTVSVFGATFTITTDKNGNVLTTNLPGSGIVNFATGKLTVNGVTVVGGAGGGGGSGDALTSGTLAQFSSTTSLQLAGVLSDEIGTGKFILSPGGLNVTVGKTLNATNTLTFSGTDGSTLNVGTGGTLGSAAFTPTSNYATAAQGTKADSAAQRTGANNFIGTNTFSGGSFGITVNSTNSLTIGSGPHLALKMDADASFNPRIGMFGAIAVVQQSGDVGAAMRTYGWLGSSWNYAASKITGRLLENNLPLGVTFLATDSIPSVKTDDRWLTDGSGNDVLGWTGSPSGQGIYVPRGIEFGTDVDAWVDADGNGRLNGLVIGPNGLAFEDATGPAFGTFASSGFLSYTLVADGFSLKRSGDTLVGFLPQDGLQFKDEGTNLGAAGTVTSVNFVGSGVAVTRSTNALTVTVSGGSLPAGGTAGQYLKKLSGTDGDADWAAAIVDHFEDASDSTKKLLPDLSAFTTTRTWRPAPSADSVSVVPSAASGLQLATGITSDGVITYTTPKDVWILLISDETTALTTGTAKVTFRAPRAATVTGVRFSVNTVSSSGLPTVDIKKNGTSILTTLLSIDASEKTSVTAATPAVIGTSAIADDDEITIDQTVAGTDAKGGKVYIYVTY